MPRAIITRADVAKLRRTTNAARSAERVVQRIPEVTRDDIGRAAGGETVPTALDSEREAFGPGGANGEPVQTASGIVSPDGYKDRLLKYIPAEVVAVYLTIQTIVASDSDGSGVANRDILLWVITLIILAATPIYLSKVTNVHHNWQLGISTLACLVWIFSLGGPFESFEWYDSIYGAVALPLATFLLPLVEPRS